jgi:hexosaminidase
VTVGRLRDGDLLLRLRSGDADLGEEGYRLHVGRTIRISARTSAGAFAGTRTVLQLARQGPLPAGTARDWPRYPERGLMIDVARRFYPAAWIEARIRELSYLKLNYLHLHLSDDQGFRMESATHPEIVSTQHYTSADLREILALARRHHVTVVPEIDMPGHMQAALAPHPEYQLTDVFGRRAAGRLDVTNPAAVRFAHDLIEEYLKLFDGPYWHGGGDELMTPVEYPLYPQLQAAAQAKYGASANGKDAVHGFANDVDDLVRARGRALRMWHDDLGGGSAVAVHPDVVTEWWIDVSPLSAGVTPSPQSLLDQGHRIMNGGWFPTYYVNGPLGAKPLRPDMKTAYEAWAPNEFSGPLVFNETLRQPPQRVAAGEPRNLGAKLHVWNDDPTYETEQQTADGIRPRLQVIAQKTWGSAPLAADYASFQKVAAAIGH